jgi:hypothetical protein
MSDPSQYDFELHHRLLLTSWFFGRIDEAKLHAAALLERHHNFVHE